MGPTNKPLEQQSLEELLETKKWAEEDNDMGTIEWDIYFGNPIDEAIKNYYARHKFNTD